mgnify:CR=1 FL=1
MTRPPPNWITSVPKEFVSTSKSATEIAAKAGAKLGVAALVALCTSLLKKSVRGGMVIVGELNLGGSIELVHNGVVIASQPVSVAPATLTTTVTVAQSGWLAARRMDGGSIVEPSRERARTERAAGRTGAASESRR